MINFFRKIRRNLAEKNKTGKYLKYAIGEIVLVMIGILLALQVNNWNEKRKQQQNGIKLLSSLRNEINADIEYLKEYDSIFSVIRINAKIVDSVFKNAKSTKDFIDIIGLRDEKWGVITINRSAYNEILNTGNLYTLKNKVVKNLINEYYLEVDRFLIMENGITNMAYELSNSLEIYPFRMLKMQLRKKLKSLKRLDSSLVNKEKVPKEEDQDAIYKKHLKKNLSPLKDLDTTWINNPKSSTYMAIQQYLGQNIDMNLAVKSYAVYTLRKKAKQLDSVITQELEQRK